MVLGKQEDIICSKVRAGIPCTLLSLICILFLAAAHAGAEDASRVLSKKIPRKNSPEKETVATIRIGKHTDRTRIVFETAESYVERASVIVTGDNAIKIDFQSPVIFRVPWKGSQKGASKGDDKELSKSKTPVDIGDGVRIAPGETGCIMTIDNLDDINVSKLLSPPRLVIDVYISKTPSNISAEKNVSGAVQETLPVPPDISDIKIESFMIDAGHGGYDSGIRSNNKAEKDIALLFAKDLANTLSRKGKKVFLTRKGDQVMSLKERIKVANRKSPGIFLSIHISSANELTVYSARKRAVKVSDTSGKAPSEKGFSGAAGGDASENLAHAVAQYVKSEFKMNVKYEKLPLQVISSVNAPAVLIELPNPEKFNYDGKARERLVTAILKGIAYSSSMN